jgi:hypothetical protein
MATAWRAACLARASALVLDCTACRSSSCFALSLGPWPRCLSACDPLLRLCHPLLWFDLFLDLHKNGGNGGGGLGYLVSGGGASESG